jgi:hypothetical protein
MGNDKEQPELKFSQMSAFGKIKHIGKVIIFLLSFGFIYPNIFSD